MPAHALGKGSSLSIAVELRLDVRDHDFQLKQPSWSSEGGVSRDILDMTMKCGLSSGREGEASDGGEQEGFYHQEGLLRDLGRVTLPS